MRQRLPLRRPRPRRQSQPQITALLARTPLSLRLVLSLPRRTDTKSSLRHRSLSFPSLGTPTHSSNRNRNRHLSKHFCVLNAVAMNSGALFHWLLVRDVIRDEDSPFLVWLTRQSRVTEDDPFNIRRFTRGSQRDMR